jgi:hypothetical protein
LSESAARGFRRRFGSHAFVTFGSTGSERTL